MQIICLWSLHQKTFKIEKLTGYTIRGENQDNKSQTMKNKCKKRELRGGCRTQGWRKEKTERKMEGSDINRERRKKRKWKYILMIEFKRPKK